jgi:hypothetical protein
VSESKAVEDAKTIIIPTRSKRKISHELSFPIGAERISIALASAEQLPQLVLHFSSDYFNRVRSGHYPFLWVRYLGGEKPINPISGVPLSNEWAIAVGPVPRVLRHRIHQYIVDSALPRIKQWLDQRVNLAHSGSESLTFFFDERKEEFVLEHDARLQPIREVQVEGPKTTGIMRPAAKPKKEHSCP